MKITKKQLKQIVEQSMGPPGHNWPQFMNQIEDMQEAVEDLRLSLPFRSAGVRMAIEKIIDGFDELKDAVIGEDEARAMMDD